MLRAQLDGKSLEESLQAWDTSEGGQGRWLREPARTHFGNVWEEALPLAQVGGSARGWNSGRGRRQLRL